MWTAGLAFVSHGSRVGIRTNDASLVERLPSVLPPGSVQSTSPLVNELYSLIAGSTRAGARVRHYNLLYAGSTQAARTLDLDETFRVLREYLHFGVAVQSPRRLFVRASVVGWNDRALVVAGDDAVRIASVVGALIRAGAIYYSTRYAVFDQRGRVHAYPTPPDHDPVNDGAQDIRRTRSGSVAERIGRRPLPVGLIIIVGAICESPVSVRELSPAQAALILFGHTVVGRFRPQFALSTLRASVAGAVALGLAGDSGQDIVAQVIHRLRH